MGPEERITGPEIVAHGDWLTDLARSLTGDRDTAADLVQEAMVVVLQTPRSRVQALRPYLAGTMRHLFWRQLRTNGRRTRRELWACVGADEVGADVSLASELEEQSDEAQRALHALREPYRSTLSARFVEGRTPAEIARAEGVAEGTVRWRTREGLAQLRRALGISAASPPRGLRQGTA